ncbi:hypothetical protein IM793_05685 [Pedobacter sp. MR2016-19]|uniref:hypothetical protein n=1 Tax=Pedobacter sp. MR2016-19 TaxID=2780089 RepID=UPI001876E548|nr:hypothetical protein [Pedobacter sp. MR2016-19]MBE5318636.1 hypothetical protein [Pedobacter sp. MR2016-19]
MSILAAKAFLINQKDNMKIVVLILNRVYSFLEKVGNQSPLLGAVILVTILISSIILSISLCVFAFKDKALHIRSGTYFLIIFGVFILLYLFANRYKEKITSYNIGVQRINNIYVLIIYVVALGTFIFLSNINRQKIFKDRGALINRK